MTNSPFCKSNVKSAGIDITPLRSPLEPKRSPVSLWARAPVQLAPSLLSYVRNLIPPLRVAPLLSAHSPCQKNFFPRAPSLCPALPWLPRQLPRVGSPPSQPGFRVTRTYLLSELRVADRGGDRVELSFYRGTWFPLRLGEALLRRYFVPEAPFPLNSPK